MNQTLKYSFSFACVPGTFPFSGISEFLLQFDGNGHRVHTEWQRTLSGAHSIMKEKLSQAGEGGGSTSISFHYTLKNAVKLLGAFRPDVEKIQYH
jgi:hypothetical protein